MAILNDKTQPGFKQILFETKEQFQSRPDYVEQLDCQDEDIAGLVGGYRFDKAHELQCRFSGCTKIHQNGYIIFTHDGVETHCGNRCGTRIFKDEFTKLVRNFENYLKREDAIARLKQIQNDIEPLWRRLGDTKEKFEGQYREIQTIVNWFRSDQTAYRLMTQIYKSDGNVRKSVLRKPGLNESGSQYYLITIGRIEGLYAFINFAVVDRQLREAEDQMRQIMGADVEKLKPKQLTEMGTFPARLEEAFRTAERFFAEVDGFFDLKNFESFKLLSQMEGMTERQLNRLLDNVYPYFRYR